MGKAMGPPGAIVRCPCGNVLQAHESFHLVVTRNSRGQKGSVSQEMKVDVEVKRSQDTLVRSAWYRLDGLETTDIDSSVQDAESPR